MTELSPIAFFTDANINLGVKLLEAIFAAMGLICILTAIKNAIDPENPSRFGTALFWGTLGVVLAIGRFLPSTIVGILIFIMAIPAIVRRVKIGRTNAPTADYSKQQSLSIGMKIFLPALSIGAFAIIFALIFTALANAALIGVSVGVIVAIIVLMVFDNRNRPGTFVKDSERLLSIVGPLCMLPMLLASLGAIFTAAGVGSVIAALVGHVVPQGNVDAGIVVYAIGMTLFTMIMGNAFAAITVMTVGIGYPFVLAYGASPVVIGMVALTCGFCGTLMTPMAANFNIVPVAMLDMKSRYGVIKQQVYIALPLLVFQIAYMIMLKGV